jgi:DNA-binding SARP family transcriptional activator
MAATVGVTVTASASTIKETAFDQIDQSFRIPVTNPVNRTDLPAVLRVLDATLTTDDPSANSSSPPKGEIYLTVHLSCGPVHFQNANLGPGDFFSTLTPLPATALRYVTASGRVYEPTRIDPINQANNPYASNDNGLVDATYYFTVPITNRRGTFEILPSRTFGTQYEGYVAIGTATLEIGGPTKVALQFPKKLTVTTSTPHHHGQRTETGNGTMFASMLNFASTLLGVFLVGSFYLARRRSRRRRARQVQPIFVVRETQGPVAPAPSPVNVVDVSSTTHIQATPTSQHSRPADNSTLRVDVLGPLTISPTNGTASDPVRAIVAYLAMNNDRPHSLEEIQTAIWPLTQSGTDIKRPVMRNYMADARRVVGERHLPTASGRSGYQLVDVTTDWSEFEGLVAQSQGVAKPAALPLRRQALALVRGVPFTADTSRYFTWAISASVVYKITEAISTLAHVVSTDLVLAGDLSGAEWALRQGLLCEPACVTLWEGLTDVLLEGKDASLLDLHWKAAETILESDEVTALRARKHG